MRYLEWALIGLFGSLLFLLAIIFMILIMPIGCSTSTLKPADDRNIPQLATSCQKMDKDSVAWALSNNFKVKSQDTMTREVNGNKFEHFRRVIFNDQVVVFIYYINSKDLGKLKEYASMFQFIDNCVYRSYGQYQVFIEYKKNNKPKKRLI